MATTCRASLSRASAHPEGEALRVTPPPWIAANSSRTRTAPAPSENRHRGRMCSKSDDSRMTGRPHGTGSNELDIACLAAELDPEAAVLVPRGPVQEHGMPHSFRRHGDGNFVVDDVIALRRARNDFAGTRLGHVRVARNGAPGGTVGQDQSASRQLGAGFERREGGVGLNQLEVERDGGVDNDKHAGSDHLRVRSVVIELDE